MNQYGFEWPKRMACEQFPELEKGGASCLSRPKEAVQPSLPSTTKKGDLSLSLFTKPVKILQFWKHFCLSVRLEHR